VIVDQGVAKKTNMVSIIVPIFNGEKYINRCIESILKQTFRDIEIIIIDDGSSDDSAKIVDELSREDCRIVVIHKKHEGLLAARLHGVKEARGKIIGFVDCDDFVEPEMFETMYKKYSEYECDLVSMGIIRDHVDGSKENVYDHYPENLYDDLENDIYPTMLYDFSYNDFGIYCTLVNKLFRRELIRDVLETIDKNIKYGEDAAVFYRYCLRCRNIYIMHKAFYHYCIRNDSMCFQKDCFDIENNMRLFESLKFDFERSNVKHSLMRQLKRYIIDVEMNRIEQYYDINPAVLNRWEYVISEEVIDKKFILYGAGGCGQAFFHWLRRNGKDRNLIAWVDKNYQSRIKQCDYDLIPIGNGLLLEYSYIIIAIKDKDASKQIREELAYKYNIPMNKIVDLESEEYSFFTESFF